MRNSRRCAASLSCASRPPSSLSGIWPAAILLALASCRPAPPADTVIFGRIWTGDTARPWVEGVAIRDSAIAAVGDSAEVARLVGPETDILPGGGMIVPGFMDGHTHFLSGGFQLASVDLRSAATPEEFIRRIREYAATLQSGEWILGGDWDHERWPGAGLPRRDWIDSVTPDNPVFVSRLDGHMGLANSLALSLAGVGDTTADVAGGTIVRYSGGRRPTGVLKDNAMGPIYRVLPDPSASQLDSALARAMAHAAEHGVTAIAEMNGGWSNWAAYRRAKDAGRLTLRVTLYHPLADWRGLADTVAANGRGDAWLGSGGLKGFVDGSLGSTTAAFFDPYLDEPGTSGKFVTDEAVLREAIGGADSAGLQVAIHAIGDRANAVLLDIFDSVATAHGSRDRRFRIEHAQHLRPQDIERVANLDVVASMQPYHAIDDGRWAQKRIGAERIKTTYAFRSLLDAGAMVAFGSDWTVAPLDPILGIYGAVTRRTIDGANPDGWVPEQRITVEESLRAYTAANAFATYREARLGRLAPGYLADLVILDRDLTTVAPETLDQARVLVTVVGGRVVYRRP